MIVLDTNLLIYAHRSATPEHTAARKAIDSACNSARGAGISLPSVSEFFSVVTHPASSGRPSTAAEAGDFITALENSGGVRILLPHAGFHERLLTLARDLEIKGPRIFDLQIALTGLDNGATELWTRDQGFIKIPGLKLVNPF